MVLRDVRKAVVRGKKVILRVDYNISVDRHGRIRDLRRMVQSIPTIVWLLKHGAAVLLVSHRGRPVGREKKYSLQPMVKPLRRLVQQPVEFVDHPIFSTMTTEAVRRLRPGQIMLLENIRYEAGEAKNSPRLARRLASFADLVVNDAFSDSHRAHASIVGVAKRIPAYAGLLVQNEVKALSRLLRHPHRPYVAILGGAKISTKLQLLRRLLRQADKVLLGGALANTLLQAEGQSIGKSLSEPSMLAVARGLTVRNTHLAIPCDVIVANDATSRSKRRRRAVGRVAANESIFDIGPDTVEMYRRILQTAKTIIWNGPMGLYEVEAFARGTKAIARAVAMSRAKTYVGGGETLDALQKTKLLPRITWCSTGGGAMLEFLEGKTLPGLQVVSRSV